MMDAKEGIPGQSGEEDYLGLLNGEKKDDIDVEKEIVRRVNPRLIPVGVLVVLLCYVDRGNIGFAANSFCASLGLSEAQYGKGAGLFYAGYAIFQVPSNIVLAHVGAHIWLGVILIAWGIVATSMAFVKNATQFYVARFFLGIAEAGTFPGLWYYFASFYPEKELTIALSYLELALIMSTPISSPFAVGLLSMDGWLNLHGWQWLFLLEGVWPLFLGIAIFFLWPKNPQTAKFLTDEDKKYLAQRVGRVEEDTSTFSRPISMLMNTLFHLIKVVKLWGFWIVVFVAFIRNVVMHVVLYFTTLFVEGLLADDGQEDPTNDAQDSDTCSVSKSLGISAVLLSAIPFAVAAVATLSLAWVSKRVGNRPKPGGVTTVLASVFFTCFPYMAEKGFVLGFAAYSIGVIGCYAPFTLLLSLLISYIPPESKSEGIALFNTIAMLGGLVGPVVIGHMAQRNREAGYFQKYSVAIIFVGALMGLGGIINIFLWDPFTKSKRRLQISDGDMEIGSMRQANPDDEQQSASV